MHKTSLAVLLCFMAFRAFAQTETDALPSHSGAVVLDLTGLKVTQRSAKPDGREIGVRAHDAEHMELLTFLFLTPDHRSQTAASCLEQDIKAVMQESASLKKKLNPLGRDDAASATVLVSGPNGFQTLYRYSGTQDECLMLSVYADKGSVLDVAAGSALLDRQRYDPNYSPRLDDASKYEAIRGAGLQAGKTPPARAPRMLVGWYEPGGIVLPSDPDWKIKFLTAYDKGARPSIEYKNEKTQVIASFIIFENATGKPTSESCRDDVMEGIRKNEGELISKPTTGIMDDGKGGKFATASHFTRLSGKEQNHDVFAFAGNARTCAEVHLSTVAGAATKSVDWRLR